jgi:hypothetical protein
VLLLNKTPGRPLNPVEEYVGATSLLFVAFSPFPDLSFHVAEGGVDINVVESAASNHTAHPGREFGENVVREKLLELEERSAHFDTRVGPPEVVIVFVACASNHTDKFDRRDGLNR